MIRRNNSFFLLFISCLAFLVAFSFSPLVCLRPQPPRRVPLVGANVVGQVSETRLTGRDNLLISLSFWCLWLALSLL